MSGLTLLSCVVNMGDASKVIKCARKYGVKGATVALGMGTIHSRLLDFLGINEVRKEIVMMIVENEFASGVIKNVGRDMRFDKPHHGIAFTNSVRECIGSSNIANQATVYSEAGKSMYKIIYAIVDKGRGEDVVDAANEAGARGGTIVHARGSGVHEVQRLFSVEIEPEKDAVFIIAKTALKDKIVESIRTRINIGEPGAGILYVQDVEEVYGLHEG